MSSAESHSSDEGISVPSCLSPAESTSSSSLSGGTCFYFGTFNPIHSAHLMIAQAVLNQFRETLGITSVTFIPAASPPHRENENDLLPARHRLNMVRLATESNASFRVSDIELQRQGVSYTIETLRQLVQQGQTQPPVPMIIGSDALAGLVSWHEPMALIETACFLQAPRPDHPFITSVQLDGQDVPLNTRLIEMPMLSLSATFIRQKLREKALGPAGLYAVAGTEAAAGGLRYFLPEAVRQYIRDNRLYAGSEAS